MRDQESKYSSEQYIWIDEKEYDKEVKKNELDKHLSVDFPRDEALDADRFLEPGESKSCINAKELINEELDYITSYKLIEAADLARDGDRLHQKWFSCLGIEPDTFWMEADNLSWNKMVREYWLFRCRSSDSHEIKLLHRQIDRLYIILKTKKWIENDYNFLLSLHDGQYKDLIITPERNWRQRGSEGVLWMQIAALSLAGLIFEDTPRTSSKEKTDITEEINREKFNILIKNYNLNIEQEKLIRKIIEVTTGKVSNYITFLINMLTTFFEKNPLWGILGIIDALLFPVKVLFVDISHAYGINEYFYGIKAKAYALTAWAFEDPLPLPPLHEYGEVGVGQNYEKVWNENAEKVYNYLTQTSFRNVSADRVNFVFGNKKIEVEVVKDILVNISDGDRDKLSLITWNWLGRNMTSQDKIIHEVWRRHMNYIKETGIDN